MREQRAMIGIFAQAFAIGSAAVTLIIVAAIVGIALVVIRAAGISVPSWVVQVLWILLAACVGVFAIKLLLSMF